MPIQLNVENNGKMLLVTVSRKLAKSDYEHFVNEFERLIQQHGKVQGLFDMIDFHGWEAGAMWEDTKFAINHFADIERLAMIGDKKWQHVWRRSVSRSPKRCSDTSITSISFWRGSGWQRHSDYVAPMKNSQGIACR